jgi:tetratricopeptide (TPR) repeat protein
MAAKVPKLWRLGLLLALAGISALGWRYGYPWWVEREQASYLAQCSRAQELRQWDELERLSSDWTQWQPDSDDAWIFRADAAQRKGDFSAAVKSLSAIPDTSPKALPAYIGLATLQFGPANQPLAGVRTSERLLKLEPRTAAAHQQLIEFYAITLQREKLIKQIRHAIELKREPRSAYVYLFLIDTMRLDNAVETNDNWLKVHPDEEIFMVARGLQLPEPGPGVDSAYGNKHKIIAELLQRFPNNIELLAYQTDLAIRVGNVSEVAKLLLRVPPAADNDSRFWSAKGWLHLNQNELPEAKQALLRALELHPLDWGARNRLADLTRRQGDLDEAQKFDNLLRQARRLRERMTEEHSADVEKVAYELLSELANHARRCGDKQVTDALSSRLSGF